MNKRISIEIPEPMYLLLNRYADLHGFDADSYIAQVLHRHLEDLHDIAAAEAAMERIRNGNSKTYTMDQLETELGFKD